MPFVTEGKRTFEEDSIYCTLAESDAFYDLSGSSGKVLAPVVFRLALSGLASFMLRFTGVAAALSNSPLTLRRLFSSIERPSHS